MTEELTEMCPHCGARMREYWHPLNPGLVVALGKLYKEVRRTNKNDVDINGEMDRSPNALDHTEKCNWQKLRLHGLVARVEEHGEVVRSRWLLTRRAGEFLRGAIKIPFRVKSFRNKVIDHDERLVDVFEVMSGHEYWHRDFAYDIYEPRQEGLL